MLNIAGILAIWNNKAKKGKAVAFRYDWGKVWQVSGRINITVREILAEASAGADGMLWCESRLRRILAGMGLQRLGLIQKQAGFFDCGRYKAAQSVKQQMVFLSESIMKSEIGVHVNSTADF